MSEHRSLTDWILLSPVLVFHGVWTVVRALFGLPRKLAGIRSALLDCIPCPNGHAVPTQGRFQCACGVAYVGWVGRCPVCHGGAHWTPCPTCGVSVVLPWE